MNLITLESKKLLKVLKEKEMKKFLDKSLIVVISDSLTTDGSLENVTYVPQLMPPAPIIQKHLSGDIVGFREAYFKYLQVPALTVIVATLFDSAAKEGKNVAFLCSYSEDNYNYLDILAEYTHAVLGIQATPHKKLLKGKAKEYASNSDSIIERCQDRYSRAVSASPSVFEDVKRMFEHEEDKKKKKKGKKKK